MRRISLALIACVLAFTAAHAAMVGQRRVLLGGHPYYPTPNITPAGLTFSVVAPPVRNTDLFSSKFPIDPVNTFQSSTPAADYTEINAAGSPVYAYGAGGATISAAAAGQGILKSKVQPLAPYMFAEAVIASAPTNGTVSVGIADAAAAQYMIAQYAPGTGVSIISKINGTNANLGPNAYTVTGYPFTLRVVVEWPEVQVWITDGNGTRLMSWRTLPATDLRLQSKFQGQGFTAYFSAQNVAAGAWSATFASFRSGYSGAIGLTNYKPVTYLNGQPYVANGKAYFFATCNNGNSFQAGHGAIMSVDLTTFAYQLESLLFFNVSSSDPTNPAAAPDTTTSLSVGQVLWDGTGWQMFLSDWGYDTVTSAAGVQLYSARTTTNILSGNPVVVTNAYQLALPSSATASYYDNTQYQDAAGIWHVAVAQTNALANWTSFAPSLLQGASMSSLSLVTGPSATLGEGPNWTQIGGTKYISTSGNASSTSPHWFTASLNLIGAGLFPGTIDLTTYPPLSTNYYSHYPITPISYGPTTRYMLAYMDNSSVTPFLSGAVLNGARGAPVIEMSQAVPGNEHFNTPSPGDLLLANGSSYLLLVNGSSKLCLTGGC